MIRMIITENQQNQRLDRFLKKYFPKAPLSYIYKMVRTKTKVNGIRAKANEILHLDDEVIIYISQKEAESYHAVFDPEDIRKEFGIAYEDENILIAEKPFGLLTHGAEAEHKNTLANQVVNYLIEKGAYQPALEKTFTPSPANRLDRNTTGLVMFGKTYEALKSLNLMLREGGYIRRYYMAAVSGQLEKPLNIKSRLKKLADENRMLNCRNGEEGMLSETVAVPHKIGDDFTLVEAELITGRPHQIRIHLAESGYPIIGDRKYGDQNVNELMKQRFSLNAQFLHAYRLYFTNSVKPLEYMKGKEIICPLPLLLTRIERALFQGEATHGSKEKG